MEENYAFAVALLQSVGMLKEGRGPGAVHFAFCWRYNGKTRRDLVGKFVLALAYDQFKRKWDFPGGKNDCYTSPDPAIQFLETFYKELYEELSIRVVAPLEKFVLELIRCGPRGSSLLVVCGVRGLVARRFVEVMHAKLAIRPRLPSSYLEMSDFRYLGMDDVHTLSHATSYVIEQYKRVLLAAEAGRKLRGSSFPEFSEVMRLWFDGVL